MSRGSEADLAASVVAWLRARGWDVYEEVECPRIGRADIVAVRGPLLCVVEAKRHIGLDVLAQAHRWRGAANMVSVATAPSRGAFAASVCERLGIGWLVDGYDPYAASIIVERVTPALARRTSSTLRKLLRPEHQSCARAGTNGGGYWSAWRGTTARLRELVEAHAGYYGLAVREAIARLPHHYATDKSAANALVRDVALGSVPGVALIERPGYRGRFFVSVPVGDAVEGVRR